MGSGQAREKVLDRTCKKFTKAAGRNTIVGFWSNSDPGSNNGPGGIVKGHLVRPLEKRIRRCYTILPTDEHRTSMLHYVCHVILVSQRVKIKGKDGTVRVKECYSGRCCRRH
ncbi:hypothetical protein H632_c215p3 [Helicosporidium sp. ATCC 50920]|nr:hypothetical protein H632_c215p3 [Helicosporidium sp. ATCC 50920]|eukprot:KDD76469.1 hypothetical protein H632_c215p3 [Helicosporidium sp. ATCC 50920]